MTYDETLKYFVRDAKPAGVFSIHAPAVRQREILGLTAEPLLILGHGLGDAHKALEMAPVLAWGTVVFVRDFPASDWEEFNVRMRKVHFREWDKFGTEHGRTWIKVLGDLGYGSHVAILGGAVLRTTGPVLEIGSGHSSTPFLHEICAAQGRHLVTLELDAAWIENFVDLRTPGHEVILATTDVAKSPLLREDWGVVFIDHSPGETRGAVITAARDHAEYVVAHDTEEIANYGMEPSLNAFKYRRDFRRNRPWTTVASMTKEPW